MEVKGSIFIIVLLVSLVITGNGKSLLGEASSRCENSMRIRKNIGIVGIFLPQCKTDGSYKDMQCHESTGYCWCVNPQSGSKISETRTIIKESQSRCVPDLAKCEKERGESIIAGTLDYIPQCNLDGIYKELQCDGSNGECWCVDSNTGEEKSGTRKVAGDEKPDCTEDEDVNECAVNNGGCAQKCVNTDDSHVCTCDTGYRLEADGKTCEDINECDGNGGGCAKHCVNTRGSYKCGCEEGYVLNADMTACVDVNECASNKGGCSHNCANNQGSYKCSCRKGYVLDANGTTCEDFDECWNGKHLCPADSFCTNTIGDYTCYSNCPRPRYEVLKAGVCSDVNECEKNNPCSADYECENSIGSYNCKRVRCPGGYKLVNGYCHDIDECEADPRICGDNGTCYNVFGRYYCSCHKGYSINPATSKCVDVDECKTKRAYCPFKCVNNVGSYKCICPAGYNIIDGQYCSDIDECKTKKHSCPASSHCFNTYGSYECITQDCPRTFFVKTSKNKCTKKRCNGDLTCQNIPTQSIKWQAFRMMRTVRPNWFRFTYTMSGFKPSMDINYSLDAGNEDQVFDIVRLYRGKVKLYNVKPITGPKTFVLTMHADISEKMRLIQRYQYILYLYVSPYDL